MRKLFSTRKQLLQLLSCLILLLSYNKSFTQQNLVPNQSFEQYTTCPQNNGSSQNSKPDVWYKPDKRAAAYFNRCTNNQPMDGVPYNFGGGGINYQEPKTGDAYIEMFYYNQNANNYIQVKLLDSLKVGKKYYCEHYVSLPNTYLKGCNNIAMLFTNNPIYVDTNSVNYPHFLPENPQIISYGNPIVTDTMGWVKISGIFTAHGGEQYLTLGNFKLASETQFKQIAPFGTGYNGSAYYVDDVSVYNLDSFCLKADAGRDTTIKVGDSVFIGTYTNGLDSVKWFNGSGQLIDTLQPGFWVKPTSAGTYMYVLQQTVNGCFSADTVWVNVQALPLKMVDFSAIYHPPLTPPQEGNVLLQWQTANEINISHYNIERSVNGNDFTIINKVKANNKASNEYKFYDSPPVEGLGVVYYRIAGVDFDGRKTFSEVREITINDKQQTINVYPNPAKDVVYIECKEAIKEVRVIDCWGREISRQEPRNDGNSYKLLISNHQLAKGLYVIQVATLNGKVFNEKMFIE